MDRGVDEVGLIEHLLEPHTGRQGAAELLENSIHPLGGGDRIATR